MKLVLAVAALALVAASASAKCFNYNSNPADTYNEGNVGLCTLYKDESCCNFSAAKIEAQKTAFDNPVCERSDGCAEVLLLVNCMSCSPNTSDYYELEAGGKLKVTICKSVADRVYFSCSGDKDEYNDVAGTTVTKNCKLFKDDFKDGTEYFESFNNANFEYVIADDNTNCLDAGLKALEPSTAVVAAARSAAVVAVSGLSVVALL